MADRTRDEELANAQQSVCDLRKKNAKHREVIAALTKQVGALARTSQPGDDEATGVLSALLTEAMEQRAMYVARSEALHRIVRERDAEIADLRRLLGCRANEVGVEMDGALTHE
jgi:hypothetical protein